ncbi:DNA polymerase III subunit delta [Lignipirellula cremea]|uniref:DNA-directed DNA polymerase n=1 Tax=Lignipirellula cremea TaxID=2528010 RepID=A0A518DZX5_9BACT|nr:DNA polymerase III subunit delta [Lignipirellula cremea]QDU97375.1 DNA polymerase III subunit delta [Lignipirellula cremea]
MAKKSESIHAFEYLAAPGDYPPAPTTVLYGDTPFLKRLVLTEIQEKLGGEDAPCSEYEGDQAEWRDVADELCTVSLFGGDGPRLVVVREADNFVTRFRSRLEDDLAAKRQRGVLVLEVSTWASNTKLYQAVDKSGQHIECRPPLKAGKKTVDMAKVKSWLREWSKSRHQATLSAEAADLLLEIKGQEFGLLDQELAKLALFAGPKGTITPELVRDVVGGWKTKSVWDLVDKAAEGQAAEAILQLDRLMQASEEPIALLAMMAATLRRYAVATRIFADAEAAGRPTTLRNALEQAGFRKWPAEALGEAEARLKQLGRERTSQFSRWLLDLDLAMKGSHSETDRARLLLEMLFLRLSKELGPRRRR